MSPGIPPAAVEEESADKVPVVLAAVVAEGSVGTLQAGPVGVGCAPVTAVEADSVSAVAVRGAAEAPVWILGSWIGPVIQGELGNLAAVWIDWGELAAGDKETGQTVELKLGNKVAVTVGDLEIGLALAPGTAGACGAVDRVVLPGCVEQKSVEGGVALGKEFAHLAVLVGAGSRGFAAGLGEEPGQVGRNTVPGPESHILLVPAVRRIPSVAHMAFLPCLQGYVLAFPLDISGDPEGHNPGQGNRAPVGDLREVPAVVAGCMDCLFHMVDLSSFPLGPWDQEAGFYLAVALHFPGS